MKIELSDKASWLPKVNAFLTRYEEKRAKWKAEVEAKDKSHRDWYNSLGRFGRFLNSAHRDVCWSEYMIMPSTVGVSAMYQLRTALTSDAVGVVYIDEKEIARLK